MKHMDTITTLFSHNLWANLSLLEVCAELTPEQLDTSILGTYGTIYDTLAHIVRAEKSYFSRISTGKRHDQPEDALPMTVEMMIESVRVTGAGFVEWAPKIKAEDTVQIDWDGIIRAVPKTIILTQVINHATEHRAQIMATLTQMGIEPPELDSWTYFQAVRKSA